MNTITKDGQTHPFTTRDELFAIARKITGLEVTHIYRDGLTLCGFDSRPVMHILGTLKEPVVVPKLSHREGLNHE